MDTPRLTSLAHGGGCGCKIAPGILTELLKGALPRRHCSDLLVGLDTSDDAAVYRLNDEQALISTTDFFMPIVDDPFDFGRIAACNALSDVYAMGGRPLLALAIAGMPINVLPHEVIREIFRGGETMCAAAGIPIAGGHSIDSVEPIYGLAVTGVVDPKRIKRNSTAQAGDLLVLGKPLGVGIFSAAFKKGLLDADAYSAMIETTTQLNTPGTELVSVGGCACDDRRDRVWIARASVGDVPRQRACCTGCIMQPAVAHRGRVVGARGYRYRCLVAQLALVWHRCRTRPACGKLAAGAAYRSPDLWRTAGGVQVIRARPSRAVLCEAGVRPGDGYRANAARRRQGGG